MLSTIGSLYLGNILSVFESYIRMIGTSGHVENMIGSFQLADVEKPKDRKTERGVYDRACTSYKLHLGEIKNLVMYFSGSSKFSPTFL